MYTRVHVSCTHLHVCHADSRACVMYVCVHVHVVCTRVMYTHVPCPCVSCPRMCALACVWRISPLGVEGTLVLEAVAQAGRKVHVTSGAPHAGELLPISLLPAS